MDAKKATARRGNKMGPDKDDVVLPEDRVIPDCLDGCMEIRHWQDAIRDKVIEVSGASDELIDGSGCDSGDPLDLTLTEIAQGFAFLRDLRDAPEKEEIIKEFRAEAECNLRWAEVHAAEGNRGAAARRMKHAVKLHRWLKWLEAL
jgi:hypothetical protein